MYFQLIWIVHRLYITSRKHYWSDDHTSFNNPPIFQTVHCPQLVMMWNYVHYVICD